MTHSPTKEALPDAAEIARKLGLGPHPEGGYFRRVYCHDTRINDRALASSIYYLIEGGAFSKLHRFDADEIWCWHNGAPLTLEIGETQETLQPHSLGPDVFAAQNPQIVIPAGMWQRARPEGPWTLVSCVVSPEFLFDTFEMED